MHNVYHGYFGGTISWFLLQVQSIPGASDAIKAIISILVGLAGTVLSYYLNKWLVNRKTSK
jgi:uncharacterized membrane protein YuzA (DUF378 family)